MNTLHVLLLISAFILLSGCVAKVAQQHTDTPSTEIGQMCAPCSQQPQFCYSVTMCGANPVPQSCELAVQPIIQGSDGQNIVDLTGTVTSVSSDGTVSLSGYANVVISGQSINQLLIQYTPLLYRTTSVPTASNVVLDSATTALDALQTYVPTLYFQQNGNPANAEIIQFSSQAEGASPFMFDLTGDSNASQLNLECATIAADGFSFTMLFPAHEVSIPVQCAAPISSPANHAIAYGVNITESNGVYAAECVVSTPIPQSNQTPRAFIFKM